MDKNFIKEVSNILVSIESNSGKGTGFFIKNNIIITASHVVLDANIDSISISSKNIDIKNITVININNPNNYIALLTLKEEVNNLKFFQFINNKDLEINDNYYLLGYKDGNIQVPYQFGGKLLEYTYHPESNSDWSLSIDDNRIDYVNGMSGSPVFIDNLLIGILQSELNQGANALFIEMSSIRLFTNELVDNISRNMNIEEYISTLYINASSIESREIRLYKETLPNLNLNFFEIDDNDFIKNFSEAMNKESNNIYISGVSKEETFFMVLNELSKNNYSDRTIIIEDIESWIKLQNKNIENKILVADVPTYKIPSIPNNINIFIYSNGDTYIDENKLNVRRRTKSFLNKKLKEIGLEDNKIIRLLSNDLYKSIYRELYNGFYSDFPIWFCNKEKYTIKCLLLNQWSCKDIKNLDDYLGDYNEFFDEISKYNNLEEPIIIEKSYYNKKYCIANSELAVQYFNKYLTDKDIDEFLEFAEYVFLDISENTYRYSIKIVNENTIYTDELKNGLVKTILLIGTKISKFKYKIDNFIENILSKISNTGDWKFYSKYLPDFCETSPSVVIKQIERGLNDNTGLIDCFNKNVGIFEGANYYTYILSAIEKSLYFKETKYIAVKILLELDNKNINYKIANNPKSSINDIFRIWINIYPFSSNEKIKLINSNFDKYKNLWDIIYSLLPTRNSYAVHPSNEPLYREYEDIPFISKKDVDDLYNTYAEKLINSFSLDSLNNNFVKRYIKILKKIENMQTDLKENFFNNTNHLLEKLDDADKSEIRFYFRKSIYESRFHTSWNIDCELINKMEDLYNSINFKNDIYKYTFLFNEQYNFYILSPSPYKSENYLEINSKKFLVEKRALFNDFKKENYDLFDLLSIIKSLSNSSYFYGRDISEFYSKRVFDSQLFYKLVEFEHKIAYEYLSDMYNGNNKSIDILKMAKDTLDINNLFYPKIFTIEFLNCINSPLIENESKEIQKKFWKYECIIPHKVESNKATYEKCLNELAKYKNTISYINFMYDIISKEFLSSKEYISGVIKLKDLNYSGIVVERYMIEEIFSYANKLQCSYEERYQIASTELYFLSIFDFSKMLSLQDIMKKDPNVICDFIDIAYLHDNENKEKAIEVENNQEKNLKQNLSHNLLFIKLCPCEYNGNIDRDELNKWVAKFIEKMKEQNQLNLIEHFLGKLLSNSPAGIDGYKPHEYIREIIEENEYCNNQFIKSYINQIVNNMGVHTVNAGEYYKRLAIDYKENADKIRLDSPKTATIYDKLYNNFKINAENERNEAENEW